MNKKEKDNPFQKKKGRISGHVAHRATHKAKCKLYLDRSTCVACNKIFRSPKKRKAHADSGHKLEVGWNRKRAVKRLVV